MMKTLKELSLDISEPEYRALPYLSYSQLSRFQSVGYDREKLEEKLESPSLTFGGAVDAMLLGDPGEFDEKFLVVDLPSISESAVAAVNLLWDKYHTQFSSLAIIPVEQLNEGCIEAGFWANEKYKMDTRIKKLLETPACEYYNLKFVAQNKSLLTTENYNKVLATVDALKSSQNTARYFAEDNDFEPNKESFNQLKFTAELHGITYKCMMDRVLCFHDKKVIIPIDLKTSLACPEEQFYINFLKWHYQLQARCYTRILEANLAKDDYFKDFRVLNYRFIFCNRDTCNPMVWEFNHSHTPGTIHLGKYGQLSLPDPEDLGKDLHNFLTSGQTNVKPEIAPRNSLTDWINTL